MKFQTHLIAFKTIFVREMLRFMRIWVQTVVPPAVTVTLYYVIFGNLIGSQISDMEGFSYIEYIVPGLILMTIITNSYSNVVSSFFSAKFQKHVEELMVSPIPSYIILLGFVAGGLARGFSVGVVVTLISLIFTKIQVHHIAIALSVVFLTSVLFSLLGFINAVFARNFDDVSIIPTFILTPLTYLGGVFYSIKMLPEFWQGVSMFNPILYMVNAFRYGTIGVTDINIVNAFLIIIAFIVVFFSLAVYLLNKGVGIRN